MSGAASWKPAAGFISGSGLERTHGPLERLKVSALAQQLDGSLPEHKQSEESPDLSVCKFPSLHSWRKQLELKEGNCCRSGGMGAFLCS